MYIDGSPISENEQVSLQERNRIVIEKAWNQLEENIVVKEEAAIPRIKSHGFNLEVNGKKVPARLEFSGQDNSKYDPATTYLLELYTDTPIGWCIALRRWNVIKTGSKITINSYSETSEKYQHNGLGFALFSMSDRIIHTLRTKLGTIGSQQITVEISDEATQTSKWDDDEKTGWTSRAVEKVGGFRDVGTDIDGIPHFDKTL